MDSSLIFQLYGAYETTKTEFTNGPAKLYNDDRALYDTAIDEEAARKADFFKSLGAKIAIPSRPCKPTAPPAFKGPYFSFENKAAN